MEVKKHWQTRHAFTGLETACLVAGEVPHIDALGALSVATVFRRLHASYIEACGYFRNMLELDAEEPFMHEGYDEPYSPLFCVEMVDLYEMTSSTSRRSEYMACKEYALRWLDLNLEAFHVQRFARPQIGLWLEETGTASAFPFSVDLTNDPESRRAQVRAIVDSFGGNKTRAANELGISRQRVDQLLREKQAAGRKQLRPWPQDPFARHRAPEPDS